MRNNESGRSMVEMLGVLAIMGILSIGGIAGYTYAMNRLKANDIIDGVNKRAVALSTYTLLGTGVSATTLDAEFANKIGDFPVALAAADPGFTLTVSEITRPVCNHVLNNGVQMARTITLGAAKVWENGVKADYTCAEDGNTIVFTFAPAAGEGGNTPTCGYCQHVENGTCVADETCDNDCPGNTPMKGNDDVCYSCGTWRVFATTETECAKCPNRSMQDGKCVLDRCPDGQLMSNNGYCENCSTTTSIPASETECAKCSNRFRGLKGYCHSCSYGGADDATATECAKCSNRFMSTNGGCYLCTGTGGVQADATECAKCPNREIDVYGYCSIPCPDGEFRYSGGSCLSCSHPSAFGADATECAKCPNRKMTWNGQCARK